MDGTTQPIVPQIQSPTMPNSGHMQVDGEARSSKGPDGSAAAAGFTHGQAPPVPLSAASQPPTASVMKDTQRTMPSISPFSNTPASFPSIPLPTSLPAAVIDAVTVLRSDATATAAAATATTATPPRDQPTVLRWHASFVLTLMRLKQAAEVITQYITKASDGEETRQQALLDPPHASPIMRDMIQLAHHPFAPIRTCMAELMQHWTKALIRWQLWHDQSLECSSPLPLPEWVQDALSECGHVALERQQDMDSSAAVAFRRLLCICGLYAARPVERSMCQWAELHAMEWHEARRREKEWERRREAQEDERKETVTAVSASETSMGMGESMMASATSGIIRRTRASSADMMESEADAEAEAEVDEENSEMQEDEEEESVATTTVDHAVHDHDDDDDDDDVDGEGDEDEDEQAQVAHFNPDDIEHGDDADDDGDEMVIDKDASDEDSVNSGVRRSLSHLLLSRAEAEGTESAVDEPGRKSSTISDVSAEREISPSPGQDQSASSSSSSSKSSSVSPFRPASVGPSESDSITRAASPRSPRSDQSATPTPVDHIAETASESDVDADADGDGMEDENVAAPIPATIASPITPTSRVAQTFALTPTQELCATSPYHAILRQPLSSAFKAQQFQQALQALTGLIAAQPIDRDMDNEWMQYALLTVHSQAQVPDASMGMAQPTVELAPTAAPIAASSSPAYSCHGSSSTLNQLLTSSHHLASFSLLTSCAKFLIKHQLRSCFGGALPTLTYIDRMLTTHSKGQRMDEDATKSGGMEEDATKQPVAISSRLPLQRTLLFVEAFERFIHHAAHGSSTLSAIDSRARDFFFANLRSCSVFFSRIRGKLIQASITADMPTHTICHAQAQMDALLPALATMWHPTNTNSNSNTGDMVHQPPSQLTVSDLMQHRLFLETVQAAAQAYIKLRNPASIDGMLHMLEDYALHPSITASFPSSSTLTLASLCYFLPAARLHASGYYQLAINAYKHALQSCSTLPANDSHSPLSILPNMIGSQACVQGLVACHLQLCDGGDMESDAAWCGQLAAAWEEIHASLRDALPPLLQPLLLTTQSMHDICQWPLPTSYMQAMTWMQERTNDVANHSKEGSNDRLHSIMHHLQRSIDTTQHPHSNPSTDSASASAPAHFHVLTSEQQHLLADEQLMLAIMQRLESADSYGQANMDVDSHADAARSLTSWQQLTDSCITLSYHHLYDAVPLFLHSSATPTNTSRMLDVHTSNSLLHVQCANMIAEPQLHDGDVDTAVSTACSPRFFSLLDTSGFHKLSQLHTLRRSMHPLPSPSHLSVSSNLVYRFGLHALRSCNLKLATTLLRRLESIPDQSHTHQHRVTLLTTLAQLHGGVQTEVARQRLHALALPHDMKVATDSSLRAFSLPLADGVAVTRREHDGQQSTLNFAAATYLLELSQLSTDAEPLLPSSHPTIPLVSRARVSMHASLLHQLVSSYPSSSFFWYHHGQLFFRHIKQMTRPIMASKLLSHDPTTEEEKMRALARKRRATAMNAMERSQSEQPSDEERKLYENDEDFAELERLTASLTQPAGDPSTVAISLLAAIAHSINNVLDPPSTPPQTNTTLPHVPPPRTPPPVSSADASSAATVWMHRLHPLLWESIGRLQPALLQLEDIASIYNQLLRVASERAVRMLSYAVSAMRAFMEAQHCASTTSNSRRGGMDATGPATSAEMPVHLLSLLTRFGQELRSDALVRSLLTLPPSTFLPILPQLLARSFHPHPFVRSCIAALIVRLAEHHPHQLAFPVCVALREEEEWSQEEASYRKMSKTLTQQSESDAAEANKRISTPRHQFLLALVQAIDKKTISTLIRSGQPPASSLCDTIERLFSPSQPGAVPVNTSRSAISTSASSSSLFLPLLSSVHRLVCEWNRIAFLWEDSWLWELRRLVSELDVSGAPPTAAPMTRARMVMEELDGMIQAVRNEQARLNTVQTEDGSVPDIEQSPLVSVLRARFSLLMAPVLQPLLELQRVTVLTSATTPHELHFQRRYGQVLHALISSLQSPSLSQLLNLQHQLWLPVMATVADIKRQMSRLAHMHLAHISPFLHKWAANGPMRTMTQSGGDGSKSTSVTPKTRSSRSYWPFSSHRASMTSASIVPIFLPGMQRHDDDTLASDLYTSSSMQREGSDVTPLSPAFSSATSLHSFYPLIDIIRTKTRPKKLIFAGSDGCMYTYLLKSREDLHLDQRMIQMMKQANRAIHTAQQRCMSNQPRLECLLSASNPSSPSHVCSSTVSLPLYCRTFSVLPLSDKSGLIRWVDGVVAVFDLYRQHQTREMQNNKKEMMMKKQQQMRQAQQHQQQAAQQKQGQSAQSSTTNNNNASSSSAAPTAPNAPRSSDLFTHRLLTELAAAGLSKHTPRKDIPLPLLVRVYRAMLADSHDVANQLLPRELWLSSATSTEYYAKQQRFTHSLATMSIVGYILGLGDRHLGNILLHLASGDVLHIDFNIALERGLKLPIPEIVPFRLTRVLTAATGVRGMEMEHGNFFHASLRTLSILREAQSLFTSMLTHTQVYAPLAEWRASTTKPLQHARKNLEARASMHIMQSRMRMDRHANRAMASPLSSSSSSSPTPSRLMQLHNALIHATDAKDGSLREVDNRLVEFALLQPLLSFMHQQQQQQQQSSQYDAALDASALPLVCHKLAVYLAIRRSHALQSMRRQETALVSLSAQLPMLAPSISTTLTPLHALFDNTSAVLSKQSMLLRTVCSNLLPGLWSMLNGSRKEMDEHDPLRLADALVTPLGPILSDGRCFTAHYQHLTTCLQQLPQPFWPRSPHATMTLNEVVQDADQQLGALHGQFKVSLQHAVGLILFLRHTMDIFVDSGATTPSDSTASSSSSFTAPHGPALHLHSITSTFVFHLLHDYVRAPLPPLNPNTANPHHLSLIEQLLSRMQSYSVAAYGSCVARSPNSAWSHYCDLHHTLNTSLHHLRNKYASLQQLMLRSMGGKVESIGDELAPADVDVAVPWPSTLRLNRYPPSLHAFVAEARSGYARLNAHIRQALRQMEKRLGENDALHSAIGMVGWRGVGSGSSAAVHSRGLLIVDDVAAGYVADHLINHATLCQLWYLGAVVVPAIKGKQEQQPKASNTQLTSSSASGSAKAKSSGSVSSVPLVSTIAYFSLHTQLYLLTSTLHSWLTSIPSLYLHHSVTDATDTPHSPLVPQGQASRVRQLNDPTPIAAMMQCCEKLEQTHRYIVGSGLEEASHAISVALSGRSASSALGSLQSVVNELRAIHTRLHGLLGTARAMLRDEGVARSTGQQQQQQHQQQQRAAAESSSYSAIMRRQMPAAKQQQDAKMNVRRKLIADLQQVMVDYRRMHVTNDMQVAGASSSPSSSAPSSSTSSSSIWAPMLHHLDSMLTDVEWAHCCHVLHMSPWLASTHLRERMVDFADRSIQRHEFTSIACSTQTILPTSFTHSDLDFLTQFATVKINNIASLLTQLAIDLEKRATSGNKTAPLAPLSREEMQAAMTAESEPLINRYVTQFILPSLKWHICTKLHSYLMPQDASISNMMVNERDNRTSKTVAVNLPPWFATMTGAESNVQLRPALQAITKQWMEKMQTFNQEDVELVTHLSVRLSHFILQSVTLDASFHVLQSELGRMKTDIVTLESVVMSHRWQLYRCAWENSDPLQVAIAENPQFNSQHASMQQQELENESGVESERTRLREVVASMPQLHPSLSSTLSSLPASLTVQHVATEPVPVSLLGSGVGGGSLWKLGAGHGVMLRQVTLARLEAAMQQLSRVSSDLSSWSGQNFDIVESLLLSAYRHWAQRDPSVATARCQRVEHEAEQRRRVLSIQTQQTSTQVIAIANDLLQMERYRLEHGVENNTTPAYQFIHTTLQLLTDHHHVLREQQHVALSVQAAQKAASDQKLTLAQTDEDLSWLQQHDPAKLPQSDVESFQSTLSARLSAHVTSWSHDISSVAPSLLPLLDALSRFLRDGRSAFTSLARHASHTELARYATKLKMEAEIMTSCIMHINTLYQQQRQRQHREQKQQDPQHTSAHHSTKSNSGKQRASGRNTDGDKHAGSGQTLSPIDFCMGMSRLYASITSLLPELPGPTNSQPAVPSLPSFAASMKSAILTSASHSSSPHPHAPISTLAHMLMGELAQFTTVIDECIAKEEQAAAQPLVPVQHEEKSRVGLSVVSRVHQKLIGVDSIWPIARSRDAAATATGPPPRAMPCAQVLTPDQQVRMVMKEARNEENLARMYEGWAPWI